MRIYGLTGGTGSGKSAAAKRFAERGIPAIDADRIGHDAIAPGGAAEQDVIAAFGPSILTEGRIDRDRLAALVFADSDARQRLNALVHPRIAATVAERCAAFVELGYDAVIVDAALLGEGGIRDPWLAGLILVSSADETRTQRLVATRGMTPEAVTARMAAQTPPESKRPLADWVIENNGTLDELYAQVDAIAREILGAAETVT